MIEMEVYCAVVVILLLVDGKQAAAAQAVAAAAVRRVVEEGRRSCDALAAKLYYYYSWTAELTGALESIRAPLLDLLRTATLRHDSLGQEVGTPPSPLR
jgi:26S proteasome regulatory subunit N3